MKEIKLTDIKQINLKAFVTLKFKKADRKLRKAQKILIVKQIKADKPSLKKIVFKLMEINPNFTDQDLFNALKENNYTKWTLNSLVTVDNYKTQFKRQQYLKNNNV